MERGSQTVQCSQFGAATWRIVLLLHLAQKKEIQTYWPLGQAEQQKAAQVGLSPNGSPSKHYTKPLMTNAWGVVSFPDEGQEIPESQAALAERSQHNMPPASGLLCLGRDTGWQGGINKGISHNKHPTRKTSPLTAGQGDLTKMLSKALLSPQRHQGLAWEAPSAPRHHQQETEGAPRKRG